MDRKNRIRTHSKEKLAVYESYLQNYLAVLSNTRHCKSIYIWDLFAGSGIDSEGKYGSAVIAAKAIVKFISQKNIHLFVNELDSDRYQSLQQQLSEFKFVNFSNKTADDFFKTISYTIRERNVQAHHLIFIDPHGYTQLSVKNLQTLLSFPSHIDYLIFIPITHIQRFCRIEGPAKNFLEDLGIEISLEKASVSVLMNKLTQVLKGISGSQFVYSYEIKNREATNSSHVLFFISKHILGAHKFLGVKSQIKDQLKSQLDLFNEREQELKSVLTEFITCSKNNIELYKWGIENGFLPKELNVVLKHMKTSCKILIDPTNSRGFYINYENYRDKEIKIELQNNDTK